MRFWNRRSSLATANTALADTPTALADLSTALADPPAALAGLSTALADTPQPLRCERCDVTWRGSLSVPCWCCGSPGAIRGEVRIFAD